MIDRLYVLVDHDNLGGFRTANTLDVVVRHIETRIPDLFLDGRGQPTRVEVSDQERLQVIREMSRSCPVKLSIYVVQPGLSKANATTEKLELLRVTENHVMETYHLPFGVIASG